MDRSKNDVKVKRRVVHLFFTNPMRPPVATKAPKAYPTTSCFFKSPIVNVLSEMHQIHLTSYVFLHVCISNQNWNTPIYKFRIISANLEPCTIPVLCWGEIRDYQEQLEKCLGISSYIQESLVSTSTFSRWPQIPEQVHQLETISSDFLGDTNSSSDSAWSLI